ncbi:MAG: Hsp20/alpha crystallin family protein [Aureliella sp.]
MTNILTKKPESTTPALRATRDPSASMREEMNDLISRIWTGNGSDLVPPGRLLAPALDVSETDNAFEVRMDIPGMNAKDFDIQVQGNAVTLSGHREDKKEDKGKTFHRIERSSGSFSRSMTLPCEIVEDEVAAQYENGVLVVKLPKCEQSKAKKISVKT